MIYFGTVPYEETSTPCGLPDGDYQLTYDLGDGDGSQCEGDDTSTANVAGDTIILASCYGGAVNYSELTPANIHK